ncbi:MAG: FtsX-like permease family protein [Acidobacteria bacterium]|nr:FtsX-like permease family protein [Acidobacteriota bacterium]
MKLSRLILRNMAYYWRTNLAVVAGVATAVAVLSGALLVGRSVRDSLRDMVILRIGATGTVVSADHFFREELATELISSHQRSAPVSGCPIIFLPGVVVHEATGARALDVNVYGVDERFWKFHGVEQVQMEARTALIGEPLAGAIRARAGDSLLLRIETQQGVPRESLFGRRETVGRTVRLACGDILSAERLGEFALRPAQGNIHSIFVPLQRLQRELAQPSRANAILLASDSQPGDAGMYDDLLKQHSTLEDAGVKLRPLPTLNAISVESVRVLLDEPLAQAAFAASAEAGMRASGVFTYLANSIRAGGHEIPYSLITAADLRKGAMTAVKDAKGLPLPDPRPAADDSIWLNSWAWKDLGVTAGDVVEVDYFVWRDEGRLETRTARFRLEGIVAIGGDIGPELAPDFPGIAESANMSSWDPPFPLDLRRIRPQDEEYWKLYRTTPKAVIPLAGGRQLWQNRFGSLSSVRVKLPEGAEFGSSQRKLAAAIHKRISPGQAGFSIANVRERALDASRGSTDFGAYFLYFSFFLIAAAILLAALFFRLGVEQRVREIGTLQAVGFSRRVLRRIFLLEGLLLSVTGSILGLMGSVAFGGLLVVGLRTWWIGAVGTRSISLHISGYGLFWGAAAGILVFPAVIAWTLHGLTRNPPRALLAGVLESIRARRRHGRNLGILAAAAFLAAVTMLLGSQLGRMPDAAGFFGAGSLLLVSLLSLTAAYLRRDRPGIISGRGWQAFFHLGTRNATHRPGRSLLCVALIASATFVIVSVEAFRRDPGGISLEPSSGTGGYAFVARSALPILHDLNSVEGREAMGIRDMPVPVRFVPFRYRSGDDASCLNLYAPREPRILGVRPSFVADPRFSFQDSMASTPAQKQNPWLLLESEAEDGAVPAIGDANTIRYILHRSLGEEIAVLGYSDVPVRLRLVAALRDSLFQGELLISEANFLRAFPDQEGFRFFLLDVPPAGSDPAASALETQLASWGFSIESSRERLAAYHRVENTYLSTFQSLGALGLVLGTMGLATVLLRNVLERRQELALLRAVGYRGSALSGIIVAENLVLLVWGLACGTFCALLSILPALRARGVPFPAGMVALTLTAVLFVGLSSSLMAVRAALRSPLLRALRSE